MTSSPQSLYAVDPVVHAGRWKTLGVLSLSLVIIGLDNTILNVALPTLQDTFDASASKLQWMVDAYLLVFAGLLLVFGTLGDRLGRKLVLQATLSIIANVFSGRERGRAIGIWAAIAAVGIGLGPLVGGLLLEWFDWWSVFMVNVPFAAAALLLGIRYVPESRDPRPGSFDLLGAALSTTGFAALVYGIVEAPDEGWLSGLVLGALAVATALLATFVWWERRISEPMLDFGFFRDASFSVGTAAVSVAFFALLGGIFALTQYLQFAHGYSTVEAGAIMSPMALGLMIGAGSSARAVARLGASRVVAVGLAGIAILLALTAFWARDTSALTLITWFFGLALAMGWVMAPATDAVVGAVPAAKSGVASATNTVARMVSGALGVAVVGSLVNSLYSNDLEGSLGSLSPHAQSAAEESVGAASAIAAQLPSGVGAPIFAAAGDAFTHAMGIGLVVGAALAAVTAVAVARLLPSREGQEAKVAAPPTRQLAGAKRAA
jgi:predicted MFS family arabinose efflux permease